MHTYIDMYIPIYKCKYKYTHLAIASSYQQIGTIHKQQEHNASTQILPETSFFSYSASTLSIIFLLILFPSHFRTSNLFK